MVKTIPVKDGDSVLVIAELENTLSDPMLLVPAVAQSFRVIANNTFGPVLKLMAESDRVNQITKNNS